MGESFKVKVNNTIDFEVHEDAISNLDALQVSEGKYHILQENKSFEAEIIEADFNKKSYRVKVNNNNYDVDIFNALDVLIKELGFANGATKQVNSIKAPMPGLILEINVEVGQEVQENDTLLILEAMKMENSITSPRDGIIKSVSVKKGDAVDKNQFLIEFE